MKAVKRIQSRDNPLIKRLQALSHSARDRRKLGQTVLDGPHLISAALQASITMHEWLLSEQGLARPEIAALLEARPDIPAVLLPDALFAQISPTDTPAGILATISLPQSSPALPIDGDCVLLDRVQDSGNLGSILRSVAAAGLRRVLMTTGCAQAWSPRVLRAGMGAHFLLELHEQVDALEWLSHYRGNKLATSLGEGAVSLYATDLRPAACWMFGAEGQGLAPQLLEQADQRLIIPLAHGVESLNVGAAAAVCLFEQYRQRRAV